MRNNVANATMWKNLRVHRGIGILSNYIYILSYLNQYQNYLVYIVLSSLAYYNVSFWLIK